MFTQTMAAAAMSTETSVTREDVKVDLGRRAGTVVDIGAESVATREIGGGRCKNRRKNDTDPDLGMIVIAVVAIGPKRRSSSRPRRVKAPGSPLRDRRKIY